MPWEIYKWSATFTSCSPLYFPSLSVLLLLPSPPLSVLQRSSNAFQRRLLCQPCKGDDSQCDTSFSSTTNMQLLPKVGSTPYQVLEIVCFVGMLFIQGILTLTFPPMLLWAFYGNALLLSRSRKEAQFQKHVNWHWRWLLGKCSFLFFFQECCLSSSIVVSVLGQDKQRMGKMQNTRKRQCFGTTQAHSRLHQAFKVFIQCTYLFLPKYDSTKFLWMFQV